MKVWINCLLNHSCGLLIWHLFKCFMYTVLLIKGLHWREGSLHCYSPEQLLWYWSVPGLLSCRLNFFFLFCMYLWPDCYKCQVVIILCIHWYKCQCFWKQEFFYENVQWQTKCDCTCTVFITVCLAFFFFMYKPWSVHFFLGKTMDVYLMPLYHPIRHMLCLMSQPLQKKKHFK